MSIKLTSSLAVVLFAASVSVSFAQGQGQKRQIQVLPAPGSAPAEAAGAVRQHGVHAGHGAGPNLDVMDGRRHMDLWKTSPACSRMAWNLIFGQLASTARNVAMWSSSTVGASTASSATRWALASMKRLSSCS